MQAIIFIGIQATGKSTFFKRRFVDSHLRLNLDMLRTRHRESILLEACIEAKASFVVDNTNPSRDERARYIEPARDAGFEVIGYYFSSRVEDAIERNEERPEDERIPEDGIYGALGRLERPEHDEGFDELYFVQIDDGNFDVNRWDPDAD